MLGQREGVSCREAAHGTGAFEQFVVHLQRLQHQFGMGVGGGAAGGVALAAAVVERQCRQLAGIENGFVLGRRRDQLAGIPAADADRVRPHLATGPEGVDRVVVLGGAHAVEADAFAAGCCRCLGAAVEDEETMARVAIRGILVLAVLEAPAQAFGCEQAGEEGEIALPVLRAHGTRRQFLRDVEIEAHLRVVGQQFGDDVAYVLVLENIAVAAQGEQRQRRLQPQAVARDPTVGAQP